MTQENYVFAVRTYRLSKTTWCVLSLNSSYTATVFNGFLKIAEAVRLANSKRLFVVSYSSYGAELQLPNGRAHIEDEVFIEKIKGESGADSIDAFHFGQAKAETLNVIWQQAKVPARSGRKELRLSGHGYWVSIRSSHCDTDPTQQRQLSLFN
jgi:hypothetical protein